MSTINVRPSTSASGSVGYVLYGRDSEREQKLKEDGRTRAASFAMKMAGGASTPAEFVKRAERLAEAHGRKNQLQSYVLAFHPDEFDVTNQEDLDRVRDLAVELAERMHSADYMVVVHKDSAGGHAHAHILVVNHDNFTGRSLQRYTSWKHGLRQLNDELMRDEGLSVLPDPEEPKPDWELRREAFAPGGFEQVLGDKIYESLLDKRSVNRAVFEQVLSEHGITLAVTNRDGWSYKMRRTNNGKLGRKKASGLTPEFTAAGAQTIFDYHSRKGKKHGSTGQDATGGHEGGNAVSGYADVGELNLGARRRQAANREVDGGSHESYRVREGDGRGTDEEDGSPVDLAAARAALHAAARRRDEKAAAGDRENARKRRAAAEQQRRREAARWVERDALRSRGVLDDAGDHQAAEDDGFGLG
ncbi:relaxase/mobilization nuclease domain-containing protein [Jonesiaceae bacterium BS-20]|uniref:Relaxase/mobilization nuclease domain-containing protein n=1 Tax=Jonesiaceae bacterium BS-20 TaxID=3120821 RepID=A0AAU7DW65_9MICO